MTSCPLVKPGKESARNCTKALLTKVMIRDSPDVEENPYTVDEIEEIVYQTYPSRETYLAKIAKIALHLSVHTRTGRVSWTFQNAIFNRGSSSKEAKLTGREDYLEWLFSRATDQDVFPELYLSHSYLSEIDRQQFETQMHIEHDAILKGLQEIVRQCCDSGVCKLDDMNDRYDEELFKIGSVFETAARSICSARRTNYWIPPSPNVYIPDSTPLVRETPRKDEVITPVVEGETLLTPEPVWKSLIPSEPTPFSAAEAAVKLDRQRSVYQSESRDPALARNFHVTGQITCFDVSNLIHNLAVLEKGKLLELPWDGALLDGELQNELYDKFRVEISMRRYFLAV